MRDIEPFDVLPLIVQYLKKIGYEKQAASVSKRFQQEFDISELGQHPLHSKKLKRIIQRYINNNQALKTYFQEDQIQVQQEEIQVQPAPKKKHMKQNQKKPVPEYVLPKAHNKDFQYGQGDRSSKEGYQRLQYTRGEEFKKQKGKLKLRMFESGSINDHAINSVKL